MGNLPVSEGGFKQTGKGSGVAQLPNSTKNVSQLIVLPKPSGVDDAATVNALINGAGAGSKVIAAPGTYLMNTAPLTLKGGIDYDFTLAQFTSASGSGHPIVLNKAALSSSIFASSPTATDVSTTGNVYEVDSLITTGVPTGGTFTLKFTWRGTVYTTPTIAWNSTAAAAQTAIQAALGPYNQGLPFNSVVCTGGPLPTAITVTFAIQLIGPVTNFLIVTNSLTGGASPTATVSRTTPGTLGLATITSPQLVAAGAANGKTVQVVAAGPSPNPPNLTGYITNVAGNVITLANDYNPVLAHQTLTNASAYLITRDTDIVVRGGFFNRTDLTGNGSANPQSAYCSAHIGIFRHIDRYSFSDFSMANSLDHQAWNTGDCTDFTIKNVRLANAGDGVHLNGNNFRWTIDNVTGNTHDDFIAIIGNDYSYANDTAGDNRNGQLSNIKQAFGAGLDILAGAGCTLQGLTVDGFYGISNQSGGTYPVRLISDNAQGGGHEQTGGGILDDIVLKDIRPIPIGYGNGAVNVRTIGVRNLTLENFYSSSPSGTNPSAVLSLNNDSNGIPSSIERLTMKNIVVEQMPVAGTQAISLADANIGKMTLTNSRFVLTANQFLIQLSTVSSIQQLIVSDTFAENVTPPGGSLVSMTPVGCSVPVMTVSNYQANGLANLVDTGSTTPVLCQVSNVQLTNHTSAAQVRAGGTLRIVGNGMFSNNPISNSGTCSVDCPTLQTDVTLLNAPQVGDRVYNTQLTLPAGAKPVIYDDGSGSVTGAQQYTNGGFESGVTNFSGNTGQTIAQVGSPVHSGSFAASITCGGTNTVQFFRNVGSPHDGAVITPGLLYQAQCWLQTAVTSRNWSFVINWYNSSGTFISSTSQIGVSTTDIVGTWLPLTFTTVAPALAAQYQIQVRSSTIPPLNEVHYIDDITFYQVVSPVWRPQKTPHFGSGTIALTAGVATVFNALLTAASAVRYWVQAPGGTQGTLSVAATAGKMVFTSTNVADTSTIYWELATP